MAEVVEKSDSSSGAEGDDDNDEDYIEEQVEEVNEDYIEEDVDAIEEEKQLEEVESNISFLLMRDLRFITRKELELYIRNFYEEKGLKLKISQHSDKVRLSMKCLAGNKFKPKGNGVRDNPTRQ